MSASAFLAVAAGAVLGAWSRWGLGLALNALHPSLPMGTLVANLVGGFLIGVAVEWLGLRTDLPAEVRLFAVTGFLGALTTFSTFSAEAVGLLSRGQVAWALLHSGSHLVGSLCCTFLGIQTVRAVATAMPG